MICAAQALYLFRVLNAATVESDLVKFVLAQCFLFIPSKKILQIKYLKEILSLFNISITIIPQHPDCAFRQGGEGRVVHIHCSPSVLETLCLEGKGTALVQVNIYTRKAILLRCLWLHLVCQIKLDYIVPSLCNW